MIRCHIRRRIKKICGIVKILFTQSLNIRRSINILRRDSTSGVRAIFHGKTIEIIVANAFSRKRARVSRRLMLFVARRRWRIRGDGEKEYTKHRRRRRGLGPRAKRRVACISENMGEFNFYVTLHLRSLATGAIVCLRGSAAKRHSIAGLHLRFSIMETQRAPGAIRVPCLSPLPSWCPVSPSESTSFSYSLFRYVLVRRKNERE